MKVKFKCSVLILLGMTVAPTFANTATTKNADTKEQISKLSQSLKDKTKFKDEIEQGFNNYITARDKMMLSVCTQKFSEYQKTTLSKDFYSQMKQDDKNVELTKNALFKTIKEAQSYFGKDFTEETNRFFEFDKENPMVTVQQATRGYCLNYQKEFGNKILNNLKHFQAQTSNEPAYTKENAFYLNSKNQLQNITFKIEQKGIPTLLLINKIEYPLQCSYQDVQKYEKAIAMDRPIQNTAYKAANYFYNQQSPQINYIIACTSEHSLSRENTMASGDTYPWYQPVVVGSQNEPAAGDSLVYIDKNQVVIILGHETCVCNNSTKEHCDQVKKVSREFKTRAWKLIDSLEQEKQKHNVQAQNAITSFTSYTQNEIKKDFCFIDRDGIMKNLSNLFESMKKSEPQGIYGVGKLK